MERTKLYHVEIIRKGKRGVVTIATRVKEPPYEHSMDVAFAFCSPKDRFCRKKGAMIAVGRLNSNKAIITNFSGHSADDLVNLWNNFLHGTSRDFVHIPQFFSHLKLANPKGIGLTFLKM